MSDDEVKRILEDMEKQGFPVEVRTSEILKAHDWEVTNQAAYSDIQKGKHRTVDIVAEKNVLYKPDKLGFDIWLVIECKRSTKPWAFYSSDIDLDKEEVRRKFVSSSQLDINQIAYQKGLHEKIIDLIRNRFLFKNRLALPTFRKLAHASFEPFTEGKGMSLHKAQMQVRSAILDMEENLDYMERMTAFPYGIFFVPIIVFDGHLYTYENRELKTTEGLYYYVTMYGSAFMIEILTIQFFERYLTTLEANTQSFKSET